MSKQFIDKYGQVGKLRLTPTKRTAQIKVEPLSGPSKFLKDRCIRFEKLDNGPDFTVDFTKIHFSRVKVKKDNALALAKWIISNYE